MTRDRVVTATAIKAAIELCNELGQGAEVENLFGFLAAIAGGVAPWFDEDLRVEVRPRR